MRDRDSAETDDRFHWEGYARHLDAEVAVKKADLEALNARLEAMQRQAFGRKSEKILPMECEGGAVAAAMLSLAT